MQSLGSWSLQCGQGEADGLQPSRLRLLQSPVGLHKSLKVDKFNSSQFEQSLLVITPSYFPYKVEKKKKSLPLTDL